MQTRYVVVVREKTSPRPVVLSSVSDSGGLFPFFEWQQTRVSRRFTIYFWCKVAFFCCSAVHSSVIRREYTRKGFWFTRKKPFVGCRPIAEASTTIAGRKREIITHPKHQLCVLLAFYEMIKWYSTEVNQLSAFFWGSKLRATVVRIGSLEIKVEYNTYSGKREQDKHTTWAKLKWTRSCCRWRRTTSSSMQVRCEIARCWIR